MQIVASEPPAPPAAIAAYEQEIGTQLPPDYASFLQRSNGGEVQPSVFPIEDHGDSVVQELFGAAPGTQIDLGGAYRINKEYLPADLIPIGEDPGGDVICLAVNGVHKGAVFYQAHDFAVSGPHPFEGFDNIVKIADSFDAFLGSLKD